MAKTTTFNTAAGEVKLSKKGIVALDALCKARGDVMLAVAYLKQNTPDTALCERQVWRIKRMPHVQALMIERARSNIIDHVPAASDKMVSLMDSTSQKVQFEAARRVLDIANIRPPDAPGTRVNIGIGVMPSSTATAITHDMSPEEAKAIRAEWAGYHGPGYLVDWRSKATEAETVPPDA